MPEVSKEHMKGELRRRPGLESLRAPAFGDWTEKGDPVKKTEKKLPRMVENQEE